MSPIFDPDAEAQKPSGGWGPSLGYGDHNVVVGLIKVVPSKKDPQEKQLRVGFANDGGQGMLYASVTGLNKATLARLIKACGHTTASLAERGITTVDAWLDESLCKRALTGKKIRVSITPSNGKFPNVDIIGAATADPPRAQPSAADDDVPFG